MEFDIKALKLRLKQGKDIYCYGSKSKVAAKMVSIKGSNLDDLTIKLVPAIDRSLTMYSKIDDGTYPFSYSFFKCDTWKLFKTKKACIKGMKNGE